MIWLVFAVFLLLLLAGAVWQSWEERRDQQRFPPPGTILRSGLHVFCMGSGKPVLLHAGIAASSVGWAPVQRRLASCCHVCATDRPGLGWSAASKFPRTTRQYLREMHEAVQFAGTPAILVGHSFGGLLVQLYAEAYPENVAGLVLVDPAHVSRVGQSASGPSRPVTAGRTPLAARQGPGQNWRRSARAAAADPWSTFCFKGLRHCEQRTRPRFPRRNRWAGSGSFRRSSGRWCRRIGAARRASKVSLTILNHCQSFLLLWRSALCPRTYPLQSYPERTCRLNCFLNMRRLQPDPRMASTWLPRARDTWVNLDTPDLVAAGCSGRCC